ncbi:50S ribosomal protein L3 N(5)-glutamine methyltransferase [Marinobacteraceae bacterium S3BR75-40.1]
MTTVDASDALTSLKTVRDWLRYAVSRFNQADIFYGHGTDNPWDEAVQLILPSLHLPMEDNAVFLDARLTSAERQLLQRRIELRTCERIPVPYLTGEAWFMGLPFNVDSRVLIPRSPLGELLVNQVEPWLGGRPVHRILDLCTGSGCIGIAAAYAFPEAQVDLSDLCDEALSVARSNIERHGLQNRVRAIESDLFEHLDGPYDLILSNPPYVDAEDLAAMPPEFQHEPKLALAAGDDGLDIVRRMLDEAPRVLGPDGLMIVEVGNSQAAMEAAFPNLPLAWLEFEQGGEGVFALDAKDLVSTE